MTSKVLSGLQSRFKCLGCGKCCKYGGDVEISASEAGDISINASKLYGSLSDRAFVPIPNKPGFFRFSRTFPCVFYSDKTKRCMIYDHRPAACRRYPFESLACGETTLAGVTICEGASRQVTEEFFNDMEV